MELNNDGEINSPSGDNGDGESSSRRILGGATASVLTLCLVGGGIIAMQSSAGNSAKAPGVNVPTASSTAKASTPENEQNSSPGKSTANTVLEKLKPAQSHHVATSTNGIAFSPTAPLSGSTGNTSAEERAQSTATSIAALLPTMSSATAAPSTTSSSGNSSSASTSPSSSSEQGEVEPAPSASIPSSSPDDMRRAAVASAQAAKATLPSNLPRNPVAPTGTEDGISHSVDPSGRWVITGTYQGKDIAKTVALSRQYPNGQIPASLLCTFREATLRCDAAAQLSLLNKAYQSKFGSNLTFAQGYRSLADQYYMKAIWTSRGAPGMAATPGTSNHGLGQAMDFSGPASISGTAQNAWLVNNAESYGWIWPLAMRPGGLGPHESWHFDFMGPGVGGSTGWSLGKPSDGSTVVTGSTPSSTSSTPKPTPSKSTSTASPKPSASPSPSSSSASASPKPNSTSTLPKPSASASSSPSPKPSASSSPSSSAPASPTASKPSSSDSSPISSASGGGE